MLLEEFLEWIDLPVPIGGQGHAIRLCLFPEHFKWYGKPQLQRPETVVIKVLKQSIASSLDLLLFPGGYLRNTEGTIFFPNHMNIALVYFSYLKAEDTEELLRQALLRRDLTKRQRQALEDFLYGKIAYEGIVFYNTVAKMPMVCLTCSMPLLFNELKLYAQVFFRLDHYPQAPWTGRR
jgi:hypothetical protein